MRCKHALSLGRVGIGGACLLAALVPASAAEAQAAAPWWKGAVFYEIVPRSFQDTNSDGIGDLQGITARLPYLERLGMDAILLTPMYPSPGIDDSAISDFEAIAPQYGTMADLDRLIAEADERHMHVLLDAVLDCTSETHPWFTESRSSRTSAKRDWYLWRDPAGYSADGKPIPPQIGHSGSAWEWDAETGQFFSVRSVKAPELNWRNPAVEEAMFAMLRFWLNKGAAGFRFRAVPTLSGDEPAVNHFVQRLRALLAGYPGDRVLLGATEASGPASMPRHDARAELQLAAGVVPSLGEGSAHRLDAAYFRGILGNAEARMGGAEPLLAFNNRDMPRSFDRFSDGAHEAAAAKIVAAMLLTARGTAMLYYGEEIGMRTAGNTPDGERTPMQWMPGPEAGFSSSPRPWLPVENDYRTVNVRSQEEEPGSLLRWYGLLLGLRRSNPAFAPEATMEMLQDTPPDVLAYVRTGKDGKRVLAAMNMGEQPRLLAAGANLLLLASSNNGEAEGLGGKSSAQVGRHGEMISLPPFSVWILSLDTEKAHASPR